MLYVLKIIYCISSISFVVKKTSTLTNICYSNYCHRRLFFFFHLLPLDLFTQYLVRIVNIFVWFFVKRFFFFFKRISVSTKCVLSREVSNLFSNEKSYKLNLSLISCTFWFTWYCIPLHQRELNWYRFGEAKLANKTKWYFKKNIYIFLGVIQGNPGQWHAYMKHFS